MNYTIDDLKRVYPQVLLTAKILNKYEDVEYIFERLSMYATTYEIPSKKEAYRMFKLFLTDLPRYTFNSIIGKYDINLIKEFKI